MFFYEQKLFNPKYNGASPTKEKKKATGRFCSFHFKISKICDVRLCAQASWQLSSSPEKSGLPWLALVHQRPPQLAAGVHNHPAISILRYNAASLYGSAPVLTLDIHPAVQFQPFVHFARRRRPPPSDVSLLLRTNGEETTLDDFEHWQLTEVAAGVDDTGWFWTLRWSLVA